MNVSGKSNDALPIAVMYLLFFLISFVTNLAGPMGVIVTNQFGANKALSQLGSLANFIAYACMGIPGGLILKRKGYKFTASLAVIIGLAGLTIQFISGYAESFLIYVIGAFVAGFSMCLLNIVVNPMLNTLGGGENRGNKLIPYGGTCSLAWHIWYFRPWPDRRMSIHTSASRLANNKNLYLTINKYERI